MARVPDNSTSRREIYIVPSVLGAPVVNDATTASDANEAGAELSTVTAAVTNTSGARPILSGRIAKSEAKNFQVNIKTSDLAQVPTWGGNQASAAWKRALTRPGFAQLARGLGVSAPRGNSTFAPVARWYPEWVFDTNPDYPGTPAEKHSSVDFEQWPTDNGGASGLSEETGYTIKACDWVANEDVLYLITCQRQDAGPNAIKLFAHKYDPSVGGDGPETALLNKGAHICSSDALSEITGSTANVQMCAVNHYDNIFIFIATSNTTTDAQIYAYKFNPALFSAGATAWTYVGAVWSATQPYGLLYGIDATSIGSRILLAFHARGIFDGTNRTDSVVATYSVDGISWDQPKHVPHLSGTTLLAGETTFVPNDLDRGVDLGGISDSVLWACGIGVHRSDDMGATWDSQYASDTAFIQLRQAGVELTGIASPSSWETVTPPYPRAVIAVGTHGTVCALTVPLDAVSWDEAEWKVLATAADGVDKSKDAVQDSHISNPEGGAAKGGANRSSMGDLIAVSAHPTRPHFIACSQDTVYRIWCSKTSGKWNISSEYTLPSSVQFTGISYVWDSADDDDRMLGSAEWVASTTGWTGTGQRFLRGYRFRPAGWEKNLDGLFRNGVCVTSDGNLTHGAEPAHPNPPSADENFLCWATPFDVASPSKRIAYLDAHSKAHGTTGTDFVAYACGDDGELVKIAIAAGIYGATAVSSSLTSDLVRVTHLGTRVYAGDTGETIHQTENVGGGNWARTYVGGDPTAIVILSSSQSTADPRAAAVIGLAANDNAANKSIVRLSHISRENRGRPALATIAGTAVLAYAVQGQAQVAFWTTYDGARWVNRSGASVVFDQGNIPDNVPGASGVLLNNYPQPHLIPDIDGSLICHVHGAVPGYVFPDGAGLSRAIPGNHAGLALPVPAAPPPDSGTYSPPASSMISWGGGRIFFAGFDGGDTVKLYTARHFVDPGDAALPPPVIPGARQWLGIDDTYITWSGIPVLGESWVLQRRARYGAQNLVIPSPSLGYRSADVTTTVGGRRYPSTEEDFLYINQLVTRLVFKRTDVGTTSVQGNGSLYNATMYGLIRTNFAKAVLWVAKNTVTSVVFDGAFAGMPGTAGKGAPHPIADWVKVEMGAQEARYDIVKSLGTNVLKLEKYLDPGVPVHMARGRWKSTETRSYYVQTLNATTNVVARILDSDEDSITIDNSSALNIAAGGVGIAVIFTDRMIADRGTDSNDAEVVFSEASGVNYRNPPFLVLEIPKIDASPWAYQGFAGSQAEIGAICFGAHAAYSSLPGSYDAPEGDPAHGWATLGWGADAPVLREQGLSGIASVVQTGRVAQRWELGHASIESWQANEQIRPILTRLFEPFGIVFDAAQAHDTQGGAGSPTLDAEKFEWVRLAEAPKYSQTIRSRYNYTWQLIEVI